MSKTLRRPKTTKPKLLYRRDQRHHACHFRIAKPRRQRNLLNRAGIVITNGALAWFSSSPGLEPATSRNPVRKFTDRRTAIRRIWRAIQEGQVNQIARQKIASKEAQRSNTKSAQIINLLEQRAGATLRSIMDLTGWQAHSVRGFLSAQLSKKRGLRIESFTRNGERVYRIRT